MPFNFLKYKSRHYNVTSKSLFVISVHHLLDTSTTVDCTLSSESTGQECLDNVCQRLLINQPEFFGLRYLIKGSRDELRWIDLERPLSRQLEKYAACPKLYLRVQYYIISGVSLLDDEVSRYYYFLQLKNDVVEGRISCDVKQAVLLALYCRQAEYDNYQQKDKNTIDYLKTLLPFPKRVLEEGLQESLIEEILQHNPGLQNLNQSAAEECFIAVCQQVDGYGQEKFWVKDNHSNEVQLGLSINGIAVWCQDKIKFYPWHEVKNVINLKKTFNIEQEEKQIVSFTFPEAETGRYFWRLCVLQHLFYMKYELSRTQHQQQQQQQHLQQNQQQLQQSTSNLSVTSVGQYSQHQQQQQRPSTGNQSSSAANLFHNYSSDYNNDDSQEDLLNEHLYFTESQILEKKNSVISSNLSLTNSQQQLHQLQQQQQQQQHQQYQILGQSRTNIPNIVNDYGGSTTTTNNGGGSGISGSGVFSSQIIDQLDNHNNYHHSNNRVQSTSCLDLSNNNYSNNNINGQDIERLKALLPTYRPAPDYETAVQQKYRASSSNEIQMIRRVPSQAAIYVSGGGSQPDVHNLSKDNNNIALQHHFVQQHHQQQQQQQQLHHYPDVTQTTTAAAVLQNQINHGSAVNLYSNIDLVQRLQLMRLKPPPPYSANRLSSTSTPDLAVAAAATNIQRTPFGYRGGAYVSGSSPDLVSTRTFLNAPQHSQQQQLQHQQQQQQQYQPVQYSYLNHPIVGHHHSQPYLPHGTFENLNMIEEQPPPLPQSIAPSAAVTIFSKPQPPIPPQSIYRQQQQQQHLQQQQQQSESNLLHKSTINGSIEPIYENVPFPCVPPQQQQNSGTTIEMRNRTSSIQSAPGGIHQETSNLQNVSMTGVSGGSSTNMSTNSNNHHISNEFLPQQSQQQSIKFTGGNLTGSTSNYSLNKNIVDPMSGSVNDFQHHHQQQQQLSNMLKISGGNTNISDGNISINSSNIGASTKYQEEQISDSKSTPTNPNTSTAISSFLNSSHGSGFSSTSAINDSAISSSSSSVAVIGKEKRKKRWGILGGVGKSKNTSSNEKKSATLGREKTNKNKNKDEQLSKEEANIRHRWSTGLPKLQPLSASYSKDKLCQILDSKLNDAQLFLEFERIPKRRDSARYECALLVENKTKNFDPNFLPYDDNRVRITPTMDNRHGYVNASHISSTVGTNQRFYIIAQSPYDQHTIQIFWQCVWEADVYLLVQLSEDLNYIPPTTNKSIECGQFQIYQEFSQKTDRCITSKLRLYHQQSKRFRSVWHLNYTDWAEQNCPRDVGLFLDFLEELSSVRSASINEVPPGHNTNPPVLIHCREGAGRSGVTLAADLLLYTLDHNQDLDIPRVIGQLRHQRDNLIPSLAQYKFIYALLITYLKRTRLI